ncbi:nuclease [Rhodopseudomonas sp. AAP120]|uniref:thermonuclease family protein n=1 Tax=Rhodopseudomonas sp. AAP120 TaxID=1523430 RepID=UPI0006B90724|nr:thermonuclease family protein [Rhodopseudomonas sp. AAP120]KPF94451.1 nuclease [Rhodopseudomonas sp. AAP120]
MLKALLLPLWFALLLPVAAQAADVSGVPKIRDGDQIMIGGTRIRLAGIEAPSLDQLCLGPKGDRWTCGIAARDALAGHVGGKSWTCTILRTEKKQAIARCTVDGEDIQQWMVQNGWALSYVRMSHTYDADEKTARAAKVGLWQGAFIAPWDWRVRNNKTVILGATRPPKNARRILLASASGPVAPSPDCTIKGNVNTSGECIYHKPTSRWYAKIQMKISKGTRWFCSVEDAEAAGCRETRR